MTKDTGKSGQTGRNGPDDGAESYEAFVRVFTRHEAGLRAFVRSLLPGWEDVDEVMQEASLVIWRKFGDFDPGTEFMRWACVIARFEVLKYRRKKARDRHIFNNDILDLLAGEAVDEVETLASERKALPACLAKLKKEQRALLLEAYAQGTTIKETAARAGKSATALYKTINRLRASLLDCIEETKGEYA